LRSKVILHW